MMPILAGSPVPLALLGAAAFGWLAWRVGSLTAGGAITAALLAASVLILGTAFHVLTGMGFFVLSSALSRLPGGRAAAARAAKGSRRDAVQVLANGGVAWACLLLFPAAPLLWGGAFAAAAADTWATEIGTRWGGTPRLITTLRRVPAGTSGAVSGIGTGGALLGAASVTAFALLGMAADASGGFLPSYVPYWSGTLLALPVGGLAGAFFDTLLGATVQVRYIASDGTRTEQPTGPDGTPHAVAAGWRWMDNDAVNALATLMGALVAGIVAAWM